MAKKKPSPVTPPAEPPLRLVYMSPSELVENPRNWRTHPEAQLSALTDAIGEVGWAGACLFNERTGRLIDGHARRKVALDQGAASVPVLVGDWSEEDEAKILATLDPLAAMATADADRLASLLGEVGTGSEALQAMLDELAEDSGVGREIEPGAGGDEFDATPDDGPCRVSKGDVWIVGGKHRVMCGDSTDAASVAILLAGEKVALCFTSPPYAQQRDYGAKINNWDGLMRGVFANLPMTDDGQVLVNLGLVHKDGEWVPYWDDWIGWMREQGWRRFGLYVWDQLSGFPGVFGGRCAPSHEFVFHFNGATTTIEKWVETKSEGTTRFGGSMKGDGWVEDSRRANTTGAEKIPDSVWRIGRCPDATVDHPAIYPVALPSYAIESWPGDVYDPFLGSGTTLIAAHRLGRTCYGMELEPKYCEVILRRAEAEGLSVEKET